MDDDEGRPGRAPRWFGEPGHQVEQIARSAVERIGEFGSDLIERTADSSVRLAVTGLSRSGKTVAATALVHNLLRAPEHPELLPFLSVVAERRLVGTRLVDRPDLHLPSFPYRHALELLTGDPASWPESTDRINRSRLALRFRPRGGLARLARDRVTLYLDIVDYPGEWLLDLPMLRLTFAEWSAQVFERLRRPPRERLAAEFTAFVAGLGRDAPADEETIGRGSALYRRFLAASADEGLTLLQPGRFVKPGREVSENAPMMAFFPWPRPDGAVRRRSLAAELERRYRAYRDHLVQPFHRDHFARADRQIVLVDVLRALADGPERLADMRDALAMILQTFDHGSSGWLRRILAPRIDRVLFAATKSDHVPPDQYASLDRLLEELVSRAAGDIRFEGARTATLPIAAVRCTESVEGEFEGRELQMIRGLPKGRTERTAYYPGTVPPHFPSGSEWGSLAFRLFEFMPYGLQHADAEGLPHVGLDHALEFLLGDRLR